MNWKSIHGNFLSHTLCVDVSFIPLITPFSTVTILQSSFEILTYMMRNIRTHTVCKMMINFPNGFMDRVLNLHPRLSHQENEKNENFLHHSWLK